MGVKKNRIINRTKYKTRRRKRRSGMHKITTAKLRPPTLVVPPKELLFGQPALTPKNVDKTRKNRTSKIVRYKNQVNPFSEVNARSLAISPTSGLKKPGAAVKYIKENIARRNRTLRLLKYKRRKKKKRSRFK